MIYLYGLGSAAEPAAPDLGAGLGGEPVQALCCDALAAFVGELPAAPPVNAATLAAHDAAVRRAAAAVPAFLPARFGQIFPSAAALTQALAADAERLEGALAMVRGCAQMTLRLFGSTAVAGDQAASHQPPAADDPEPADASVAAGPGTRFLAARRAAAAAAVSLPELEPVRSALAPFVRAERVRRSTVPGLVGTAYHLIAAADAASYLAAVRALPSEGGRRLAVSGPWPAYAFAPELAS